jgi:hypothetical protein
MQYVVHYVIHNVLEKPKSAIFGRTTPPGSPFSPKKNGRIFRRFFINPNSFYNTKQQLFSQKYAGFVFRKYLGELIPRITPPLKRPYNVFGKRFRQLFLSVFCAKQTFRVLPFHKKEWKIFRRFHKYTK